MSGDHICSVVLQQYEKLKKTGKPQGKEFTVLASIVLEDSIKHDFKALTIATGTKCLGRDQLVSDGSLVHDSHAEVLARRCFVRLLGEHLLLDDDSHEKYSSLLERTDDMRFKLKDSLRLHLYISEPPCGDASIYPSLRFDEFEHDITKNQLIKRIKLTHDSSIESNHHTILSFTGAKPLSMEHETLQELGKLRLKSGRRDLNPSSRTKSMSCSDKIARWTVLGIQGRLLRRWIDPIFLSSITVSTDHDSNIPAVTSSLHRAIIQRTTELASPENLPLIQVTSNQFLRSKASMQNSSMKDRCSPCGYSLNWYMPFDGKSEHVEVTLGNVGRKQGKVFNTSMCSRLCKSHYFQLICKIESKRNPLQSQNMCSLTYGEAKLCSSERANLDRDKFHSLPSFQQWLFNDPHINMFRL